MRVNYWSCSKLADRIRGTKKPCSAQLYEWGEWRDKSKAAHPIRHWIAEEGLSMLQDIVYFPADVYRKSTAYIRNRFMDQTHTLKSNLERGQWYELDHRILHCMFDELKNFVEVDAAHMQSVCVYGLDRRSNWRSREFGLDYLENQISTLDDYGLPTMQSVAANAAKTLYLWWVDEYPNRPDPLVESGVTDLHDELAALNGGNVFGLNTTPELQEKLKEAYDKMYKLEQEQESEEQNMLKRLIDIRKYLWV